jgi:serpin B
MRSVDYGQPEEARRAINRWVSAQTANEIGELLPSGALDSETALALTNAARLRAGWQTPFDEGATHDAAFALLDGSQVMVPTMEQVADLGYAMRPGLQAIELPYAGGDLSLVILLPDEGGFESFTQTLDTDKLDTILGGLTPASLHLVIPKFRYSVAFEMQSALADLGMADAFGAQADFAGIDGTRELFIDQVYHQALVDVDEAGTEASAGSAVVMARKGDPQFGHDVRVDRPFLYLIRHAETNALLFLGHVVNPAQ